MKKFVCMFLSIFFIVSLCMTSVSASDECSWFIKRAQNGELPAIPGAVNELLSAFHSYYADTTVNPEDKVLYLTFDAGYENGNVGKVLDILHKNGVKGSFFVLSHLLCTNQDLVKRMADEGHMICNHTSKHKNLARLSEAEIEAEIKNLERVSKEEAGITLAPFFRPPEGKYNQSVLKTAQRLGYTTVFWSLAYADWNDDVAPSDEKAKEILKKNTHNGAIVLLHPTSNINVRILEEMIEYWKNEGYRFATLEELKQK